MCVCIMFASSSCRRCTAKLSSRNSRPTPWWATRLRLLHPLHNITTSRTAHGQEEELPGVAHNGSQHTLNACMDKLEYSRGSPTG